VLDLTVLGSSQRFLQKEYSSEIGFGLNFHPFYLEHLGFGPLPFCE
jgi:hypothetical protein